MLSPGTKGCFPDSSPPAMPDSPIQVNHPFFLLACRWPISRPQASNSIAMSSLVNNGRGKHIMGSQRATLCLSHLITSTLVYTQVFSHKLVRDSDFPETNWYALV